MSSQKYFFEQHLIGTVLSWVRQDRYFRDLPPFGMEYPKLREPIRA